MSRRSGPPAAPRPRRASPGTGARRTRGFAGLCALLLPLLAAGPAQAEDVRERVELPAPMRAHMLANMRDHLAAMESITRALAEGRHEEAADIAEARLGMSSLEAHGAEHMARFMPEGMRATGTAMHRAASRFAVAARDAAVTGEPAAALGALADVLARCSACHAAYRVH